jgi:hypothetical protein
MKEFITVIFAIVLTSFEPRLTKQTDGPLYFIKNKGLYIHYDYGTKKKVPYKEKWEFFFTLKNDSTAIIQDIKRGVLQSPKTYKVSSKVDTAYIKRYHTDFYKVEMKLFKTVY